MQKLWQDPPALSSQALPLFFFGNLSHQRSNWILAFSTTVKISLWTSQDMLIIQTRTIQFYFKISASRKHRLPSYISVKMQNKISQGSNYARIQDGGLPRTADKMVTTIMKLFPKHNGNCYNFQNFHNDITGNLCFCTQVSMISYRCKLFCHWIHTLGTTASFSK